MCTNACVCVCVFGAVLKATELINDTLDGWIIWTDEGPRFSFRFVCFFPSIYARLMFACMFYKVIECKKICAGGQKSNTEVHKEMLMILNGSAFSL